MDTRRLINVEKTSSVHRVHLKNLNHFPVFALCNMVVRHPRSYLRLSRLSLNIGRVKRVSLVFNLTQIYILIYHILNFSWIAKSEHGVANIADLVKARLRRIAHSVTQEQVRDAVDDFRKWESYRGKLAKWFESMSIFQLLSLDVIQNSQKCTLSAKKKSRKKRPFFVSDDIFYRRILFRRNFLPTYFLPIKYR